MLDILHSVAIYPYGERGTMKINGREISGKGNTPVPDKTTCKSSITAMLSSTLGTFFARHPYSGENCTKNGSLTTFDASSATGPHVG